MTRQTRKTLPLDLAAAQAHLQHQQGPQFWRSLEELANTSAFRAYVEDEFPPHASEWHNPVSRRRFLQLMSASLALAGLGACTNQPEETILPYVRAPEELVPGHPLFFATAMPLGGFARGVLVESHMGRPTKIEGNPKHPDSLGATDVFAQAAVLSLYDPDRAQVVTNTNRISTWSAFFAALSTQMEAQRAAQGKGLRLLTETVTSPTLAQQLHTLLETFPEAVWHQYEPVNRDQARAGARLAYGEDVTAHYRFDRAEVILALDADFVSQGPGSLRYAHDFAAKRRVRQGTETMNRLYVVETMPSLTGTMADHRLSVQPHAIEALSRTLAPAVRADDGVAQVPSSAPHAAWITAVADDLRQYRGRSLVLAGAQQPPAVHALAHAMNQALGNVGTTVVYTEPVEARPVDHLESLGQLSRDLAADKVEVLLILGGNPAFTAPADLGLAEQLGRAAFRVHLSPSTNETSALCQWHIPETHFLEAWSDARAYDGTVTIMQPLIAPLYDGKSAHEVLAAFMGEPNRRSHAIVRDAWQQRRGSEADFDTFWRTALHDGIVADTALPPRQVELQAFELPPVSASARAGLELMFRPDPTVWDERFANNGWLQELPKPLTKLTWDNAALISPQTATRLGLANEDVVDLRFQGREVAAPVWVVPGHADDSVTVHLGYGRHRTGRVGSGLGFNAYALRTSEALWAGAGLELHPTGQRYPLATTQQHHSMEGRHLVRAGTLGQFQEHPEFVQHLGHDPAPELTFYPQYAYPGAAWGMVIDLGACIGCNACTIACQAENNIPIVGKTEVRRGREMHWLRIDRYYVGAPEHPETYHQPVLCMHCENAPCEVVCPVAATVHSDEGLNDMVYNRCVGTRYCSNNCPYKVRRFNFLQYSDYHTPSLTLLRNPDVTVRTRGVMEKCTYCVQRINSARIEAKKEDRAIRDGEVVTACQAACPTGAIVFGDLNDPQSRVARLRASPLNYGLLTELNTRPRTTYLARLRNPNPALLEDGDVAH